jgi:hypothetical protein
VRGCHLALWSGLWPRCGCFREGGPGTDEDPGREAVRRAPASAGPGGRSGGSRRACRSDTRAVLVLLGATSPLDGRPPHWPGALLCFTYASQCAQPPLGRATAWSRRQARCRTAERCQKSWQRVPGRTFVAGRALRRNRCSLLPQNAPLAPQLCSLWAAPHSHTSDVSSWGAVWQALRTCVTSGRRSTAKS